MLLFNLFKKFSLSDTTLRGTNSPNNDQSKLNQFLFQKVKKDQKLMKLGTEVVQKLQNLSQKVFTVFLALPVKNLRQCVRQWNILRLKPNKQQAPNSNANIDTKNILQYRVQEKYSTASYTWHRFRSNFPQKAGNIIFSFKGNSKTSKKQKIPMLSIYSVGNPEFPGKMAMSVHANTNKFRYFYIFNLHTNA